MKKLIYLLSTAAALAGVSAPALTLNEWNFYSDPSGKTLSQAVNSKGSAVFSAGGAGVLETDGKGALLCTYNDPGTDGMWTNGVVLTASTNSSSGIYFLRYDLEYDLNATNNDSGAVAGFAFSDSTGAKVAGIALQYDVGGAVAPTNLTITELKDLGTNYTGKVSVIAKVDIGTQKMDVWYDLTGAGTFTAEGSPQTNNISLNLPTIENLRLQMTGDFHPAGSDDATKVGLLRISDSFADAIAADRAVPAAKYSNEWTFERDINGRQLGDAINSGTNSPLAQFGAGYGSTVFTTNRALHCIGEDAGIDGVWTNGAVLDAELAVTTSGVHYLRYDVAYNLSATNNNSGTVLGVYFTGGTGDKAAGVVMGYDKGNLTNAIPPGRSLVVIPGASDVTNNGTLTAIAEVNLTNSPATLKVWYSLNGSIPTNYNTPVVTTNLTLTSITNLRFQATGDFRPAGSTDYADVDNIRHTIDSAGGQTAWSNIIEAVTNLSLPPNLQISVTDSLSGSMDIGETNIVTVVISNSEGAGPAANVFSTLTNSGTSSSFAVISNNAPVSLAAGTSVTNTFAMVANERGTYTVFVQAVSDETNSTPYSFPLAVGANLSFILPPAITEVSGGSVSGFYEPGETLNITVTTTNDGARTVSNAVNTLSASGVFAITPPSATYPAVAVNGSTSTTYQVVISPVAPLGTYTFSLTNKSGSAVWTNQFSLLVSVRQPNSDWVKANNTTNLNLGSSWVNGIVPNATDRAVMDQTVTAPITTDLGADLSWRGIALVSNTAAWTISGTNKLTIGSAGIDMSQAQADLTIAAQTAFSTTQSWNITTSRTLTVSGTIVGSNAAGLVKTGAGILVITNAANNYTGNTVVSNGTLAVANTNVLGKGTLTLNNSALSTAANALLTNNILLNDASVITNANTLTLTGTLSGSGSLTKAGSGMLILRGTNTYSGGTTNDGTIQIYSKDALGTGPVVMLQNSILFATAPAFTQNNPGLANPIQLAGNASFSNLLASTADVMIFDGPISGTGKLTLSGNQFNLNSANTFSGGLDLNVDSWVRFNGREALGTGPITTKRATWIMALQDTSADGGITNDIIMNNAFRVNPTAGLTVLISGAMSGSGALQRQDNNNGTVEITGNNTGRTGASAWEYGVLRLGHENALGSGDLNITANPSFALEVSKDLTSGNGVQNNINITAVMDGDGVISPFEFNLNHDLKLTGVIAGGATVDGLMIIQKNGPGTLTLSGSGTFNDAIDVTAGTLMVDGSFSSKEIIARSGTTMGGTGSVQKVTLESGSKFVSNGGMTFGGDLNMGAGVDSTLNVNDPSSALRGNGANALTADGLLRFDFSANTTVALNDTFTLFSNWATLTDNGVTVQAVGLPPFTMLDTANLFIDGTVRVVSSKASIAGADIDVIGDQTKTLSFVVTNNTGAPMTFNLSDNAVWDVFYTQTNASWNSWVANNTNTFLKDPDGTDPETVLTGGYSSNAIPIGFPFKLYGQTFTHFYVSAEGAIGLGTTPGYIAKSSSNTMPGGAPIIAPFWSDLTITNNSITYGQNASQGTLTIGYKNVKQEGGGSGLQFQTILYTNGQVKLQYQTISGALASTAACGLQNGTNKLSTGVVPETGKAVMLTPVNDAWVTYSPSGSFTVPAHGRVTITITVNAAGRATGTSKSFSLFLNAGGTVTELPVTVEVVRPQAVLAAPDQVVFSGLAGTQSSATMVLGNTGNIPLTFAINYDAASAVNYSGRVTNGLGSGWTTLLTGTINNWITPADGNRFVTAADEGYSPLITIGFPFEFYGNVYTQLSVGVNGGISLGSAGRMSAAGNFSTTRSDVPANFIAPYWGDLQMGSNSVVRQRYYGDRFVISWINMQQTGSPAGSNLTFQAVLYPDGKIEFIYQQLNGERWSNTLAGMRSTGKTPVSTNLFLGAGDTYVTTNITAGTTNTTVVTNVVTGIANRSAQYVPGNIPIITYSPAGGTIATGATFNVTVTGDARGLTPGGTNTLINTAQLAVSYESGSKDVEVQFTVTNSMETALGSPLDDAMDTDGDGISDDDERMAGTDPLNPNSTFAVSTDGGTRVLNWGYAEGRLYTVWYTTSLSEPFKKHPDATGISASGFTDTLNKDQPAVFYKVTVE